MKAKDLELLNDNPWLYTDEMLYLASRMLCEGYWNETVRALGL